MLIDRNTALAAKLDKEGLRDKDGNHPTLNCFVVFDDVISDRVAMQWCTEINRFFVQGRHLKISVFITTQHVKGLGPMLRGNLDLVVMQPMFSKDAREELAKLYAGFIEDKNIVFEFMDQVVEQVELPDSSPMHPHITVRTLIIKDWINTFNPQMKYMWASADNPDDYEPGWRLLHPEYWKQQENQLPSGPGKRPARRDVVEELEDYRAIQTFKF